MQKEQSTMEIKRIVTTKEADIISFLSNKCDIANKSGKSKSEKEKSKHTYTDHSKDPIVAADPGCKSGQAASFPVKLYELLDFSHKNGFTDILSWQGHGRCFRIHSKDRLEELLIPSFFTQSKYKSFQRQLNLYNFRRITKGKDKNGYYNELFLRDRPDLLQRILRTRVKGTFVRKKFDADTEPDFYKMNLVTSVVKTEGKGKNSQDQNHDSTYAASKVDVGNRRRIEMPNFMPLSAQKNEHCPEKETSSAENEQKFLDMGTCPHVAPKYFTSEPTISHANKCVIESLSLLSQNYPNGYNQNDECNQLNHFDPTNATREINAIKRTVTRQIVSEKLKANLMTLPPKEESVQREFFPEKLYKILLQAKVEGFDDVVSWQPHGRCFVIHQQNIFANVIMPRFFFHNQRMASFQRQLNLYNFQRLVKGNDKGGYYHEKFLRGRPELCKEIRRTRVKGTGTRKPAPSDEPNFYAMPYCHWHNPESESTTLGDSFCPVVEEFPFNSEMTRTKASPSPRPEKNMHKKKSASGKEMALKSIKAYIDHDSDESTDTEDEAQYTVLSLGRLQKSPQCDSMRQSLDIPSDFKCKKEIADDNNNKKKSYTTDNNDGNIFTVQKTDSSKTLKVVSSKEDNFKKLNEQFCLPPSIMTALKSSPQKHLQRYIPPGTSLSDMNNDSSDESDNDDLGKRILRDIDKFGNLLVGDNLFNVRKVQEFHDADVLRGRGTKSNLHPGNIKFREYITKKHHAYKTSSKQNKTKICLKVVQWVHKRGGRFLEKDEKTGKYFVMDLKCAQKKAAQAFRDVKIRKC